MRFAKAPKGTEGRLDWNLLGEDREGATAQTLELKLADGTSTLAAASGFRYGGELIGAIVVARPARTINASTLVQGRRFVLPLLLPSPPPRWSRCCSAAASRARCRS